MAYLITNEDNSLFYNLKTQTTTTNISSAQSYPIENLAYLKTINKFLTAKYTWNYKEYTTTSSGKRIIKDSFANLTSENKDTSLAIEDEDSEILQLIDNDDNKHVNATPNTNNTHNNHIIEASSISMLTSLLSEINSSEFASDAHNFTIAVTNIINSYNHLFSYSSSLTKKLSTLDKKLVDLTHYIEFTNLNACEGYKAYKLMHEITKQRREIKNELATINSLTAHIPVDNVSSFTKYVNNQKNKSYTPRILTELFP